jgi:hypothetical protein
LRRRSCGEWVGAVPLLRACGRCVCVWGGGCPPACLIELCARACDGGVNCGVPRRSRWGYQRLLLGPSADRGFIASCISRAFDDADAPCVRAASLAVLHSYLLGADQPDDDDAAAAAAAPLPDCMRPFQAASFFTNASSELSAVAGEALPASSPVLLAGLLDVLVALVDRGGAPALATLFQVDAWRPMLGLLDAACAARLLGSSGVAVEGSLRHPAAGRLQHALVRGALQRAWTAHAGDAAARVQLAVMSLVQSAMRADAYTCRYFGGELALHGALLKLIVSGDVGGGGGGGDSGGAAAATLRGSCEAPIPDVRWQTCRGGAVLACALSTLHLMLRLPRDGEALASPVAIPAAASLSIVGGGGGGGGGAYFPGPSGSDVPAPLVSSLGHVLALCMHHSRPVPVRYGALATLAAMLVQPEWRGALQLDFSESSRGGDAAVEALAGAIDGVLREAFDADEGAFAGAAGGGALLFEGLGMPRGAQPLCSARTMAAYGAMAFLESGASGWLRPQRRSGGGGSGLGLWMVTNSSRAPPGPAARAAMVLSSGVALVVACVEGLAGALMYAPAAARARETCPVIPP